LRWQNVANDLVVHDELALGGHGTQARQNSGLNVRV
jgi:hypothetical protein